MRITSLLGAASLELTVANPNTWASSKEIASVPRCAARTTAFVVLIAACTATDRSGGPNPGPTLSSIQISPASVLIQVGDSAVFSTVGHMSDGTTAAVAVDWQATGGTITSSGAYHAGATAGAFRVVASTTDDVHADTAAVNLSDTPVPLTLIGVVVTPARDTLDPGTSATFTATGQYSNGTSGAVNVTWSATGGTISTTGDYQAGAVAGDYRVIALANSAPLADTSLVNIRDTTGGPPAGTVLLTEGFDDASVAARGWYDNTNPAISTVEKHGGAGALQMAWLVNGDVPVQGGAIRHKFTGTDRLYVRYWVKYSANFVGSGLSYDPHEFYIVTSEDGDYVGPSTTHLTAYIEQNYQNGGRPTLATTDVSNIDQARAGQDLTNVDEQRAVSGCNGNSDGYATDCYGGSGNWRNEKHWRAPPMFLPNPGPGYKGDWHMVEVYFQLNTIVNGKGQNNGIAQYWFDGQLVIDKQGVLFRTGAHPNMKLTQFMIAPYIGDGSPVAQMMWVDDLVLATGKVP